MRIFTNKFPSPFSVPIEPNDIKSRKEEIKGYVAAAKLDKAVKRCMDFFTDFGIEDDDEAILLSMRYHEILNNEKKGTLTNDEVATKKTQVACSVLAIIKNFTDYQRL